MRTRNFYGVFMVQQDESLTLLIHASTYQGAQYRGRLSRLTPTLYYGSRERHRHPPRESSKATLANLPTAARGGWSWRGCAPPPMDDAAITSATYEINPAILGLSQGPRPLFTFLQDCPAKLDVILGDAQALHGGRGGA